MDVQIIVSNRYQTYSAGGTPKLNLYAQIRSKALDYPVDPFAAPIFKRLAVGKMFVGKWTAVPALTVTGVDFYWTEDVGNGVLLRRTYHDETAPRSNWKGLGLVFKATMPGNAKDVYEYVKGGLFGAAARNKILALVDKEKP